MGAVLRTKFYSVKSKELKDFIEKNNIKCFIADSRFKNQDSHTNTQSSKMPIGLILGSEASGFNDFPSSLYDSCEKISIKMENGMESLNVAVCGGILMNNLIKTS